MRIPEQAVKEYRVSHRCGFPVCIRVDLDNMKVTQTELETATISYTAEVTYTRMDDTEPLTHCPQCGRKFTNRWYPPVSEVEHE